MQHTFLKVASLLGAVGLGIVCALQFAGSLPGSPSDLPTAEEDLTSSTPSNSSVDNQLSSPSPSLISKTPAEQHPTPDPSGEYHSLSWKNQGDLKPVSSSNSKILPLSLTSPTRISQENASENESRVQPANLSESFSKSFIQPVSHNVATPAHSTEPHLLRNDLATEQIPNDLPFLNLGERETFQEHATPPTNDSAKEGSRSNLAQTEVPFGFDDPPRNAFQESPTAPQLNFDSNTKPAQRPELSNDVFFSDPVLPQKDSLTTQPKSRNSPPTPLPREIPEVKNPQPLPPSDNPFSQQAPTTQQAPTVQKERSQPSPPTLNTQNADNPFMFPGESGNSASTPPPDQPGGLLALPRDLPNRSPEPVSPFFEGNSPTLSTRSSSNERSGSAGLELPADDRFPVPEPSRSPLNTRSPLNAGFENRDLADPGLGSQFHNKSLDSRNLNRDNLLNNSPDRNAGIRAEPNRTREDNPFIQQLDQREPAQQPPKPDSQNVPFDPLEQPGFGNPTPQVPVPRNETPKPRPELRTNPTPVPEFQPGLQTRPKENRLLGNGTIDRNIPKGARRPQLTIQKLAPPNAVLNQPLIYHIVVKNIGDSIARQVVVEDRIPKGTKLTGTIPQAELYHKTLSWKLGELKPQEQQKISIRVVPLEQGQIGSVATVNFVAEVISETKVTAPRISVSLDAPGEVHVGETVPIQFAVENRGSADASGIVLQILLPQQLGHTKGNDLEYVVGTLKKGELKRVLLKVKAVQSGKTQLQAEAKGDGNLLAKSNHSLDVIGTRLAISRVGPKSRFIERPAIYQNTISNHSRSLIPTAYVVEYLPEGMEFLEATHEGRYDSKKRMVIWKFERLAPNESRSVQVKLLPKKTGAMKGVVKIYDPNGSHTQTEAVTRIIGHAALGLAMTELTRPVMVGERFSIRIQARNRGSADAKNVAISVEIPPQLQVVSADGPGKELQQGNLLTFEPLKSLRASQNSDYDVVFRAVKAGDIRVRVQISGDQLAKPLIKEEAVLIFREESIASPPKEFK